MQGRDGLQTWAMYSLSVSTVGKNGVAPEFSQPSLNLPSPQACMIFLFALNHTRGLSASNSLKPTWKQKRMNTGSHESGIGTYLESHPRVQGAGCRVPSSASPLNDPSSCSVLLVATLLGSQRVSKSSWQLPPVAHSVMIEPLVPFIDLFSPNKTLNAALSNCSRMVRCRPPPLPPRPPHPAFALTMDPV